MHRRRTFRRSFMAAFILSLALAGSTLAATSQQVTQTLTVNSSLSITGVPATLDFGAGNPSVTVNAASDVTPVVTTTNAAGANLYLAIDDFQDTNLDTIPATDEIIYEQVGSGTPSMDPNYSVIGGSSYPSAVNAPVQIAWQTTSGTWSVIVSLRVSIPANTPPGAYTSLATFSVVDR